MALHTRTKVIAAAAAGAALVALAAGPALATTDTTTTFTLTANGIGVTVPGTANLSSATAIGSKSLSGSLGSISVTDNRGGLAVAWTATVSSTNFVTGGGTTNETIAKANVGYNPGTVTGTGIGVAVGTPAVSLATAAPVVAAPGVTGAESASWNPTVSVTIPSNAVAGTYTGTLTHSVS